MINNNNINKTIFFEKPAPDETYIGPANWNRIPENLKKSPKI